MEWQRVVGARARVQQPGCAVEAKRTDFFSLKFSLLSHDTLPLSILWQKEE